jgi:hypothetical protein
MQNRSLAIFALANAEIAFRTGEPLDRDQLEAFDAASEHVTLETIECETWVVLNNGDWVDFAGV